MTLSEIYKNKNVLITGHTGFKGSWLSLWLHHLGADLCGYSLDSSTSPNHFSLLKTPIKTIYGDVRDLEKLEKTMLEFKPDIVFHLAAQPLVRNSYQNPSETFSTNVMGTLNVLLACQKNSRLRAIVNVTSDKCYENDEKKHAFEEGARLGGRDPYSASKACSEIVTSSIRSSFFPINLYGKKHQVLIASARAGNVVGGGDWAEDRIVPDLIRSTVTDKKVKIRNPDSIRPWQFVLDPLLGYLQIGKELLSGKTEFASAWNFGPEKNDAVSVLSLAIRCKELWPAIDFEVIADSKQAYESKTLFLDCTKAHEKLNWRPVVGTEKLLDYTINWYCSYYKNGVTLSQEVLESYLSCAKKAGASWVD